MASLLVKGLGVAVGSAFLENKYAPTFAATGVGSMLPGSPLFVATPLVLSGVGIYAFFYGFMVVGQGRNAAIEAAKKDGEKDVDERYGLPNLYAQGTSKHVKTFNCKQRSHQQIFETYTFICVTSTLAALTFPLSSLVTTTMYAVGRIALTNGYGKTEGDASKRYSSPVASWTWMGIFASFCLSTASCVSILSNITIVQE